MSKLNIVHINNFRKKNVQDLGFIQDSRQNHRNCDLNLLDSNRVI